MINSKIWIIIKRCFEIEITYNVIDRRLIYYKYRRYSCVVDKRDKDETKKINVVNNNY